MLDNYKYYAFGDAWMSMVIYNSSTQNTRLQLLEKTIYQKSPAQNELTINLPRTSEYSRGSHSS